MEANILCIEHSWRHEDNCDPTLKPILDWLQGSCGTGFEYEHKCTSGNDDLLWEFGQWSSEDHESFPILYLANYGDYTDLEHFTKCVVSPPMASQLRGSAHPCAIHFGPSHDLTEMANVYGSPRLPSGNTTHQLVDGLFQQILESTGAVSVSGYLSSYLDGEGWLEGAIGDLRLFYNLVHTLSSPKSHISSALMMQAGKTVTNRNFVMQTPDGRLRPRGRRPVRPSASR